MINRTDLPVTTLQVCVYVAVLGQYSEVQACLRVTLSVALLARSHHVHSSAPGLALEAACCHGLLSWGLASDFSESTGFSRGGTVTVNVY